MSEEEEEKRIVIFLITLENSQVGKTQLTQVFVDNHFEMNILTIIAYELKTKKVLLENCQKIKVLIWDIAGQERFEKTIYCSCSRNLFSLWYYWKK